MSRCFATILGVVLLLTAAAHAAIGDVVVVDNGFGRLVVEWATPVTVSTEERGATVALRASEPFPADIEARVAALGPLVTRARLSDTATLLELQPAPGVLVETVVMDARALSLALTAHDAPVLGLRLGRHAGFERIVIEPVSQHRVKLELDASRVTVTLPGRLGAADRNRLKQVAGIERVAAAGNQLVIDLAPGATAKPLFVGPDRQVLDLYSAAAGAPEDARSSTARAPDTPAAAEASAAMTPVDPTLPTAGDPPSAKTAVDLPPVAGHASPKPERVPPPWRTPSFPTLMIDAERRQAETLDLRFTWPEPVPAAVFVRGDQLWVAFAAEHAGITLDAEHFSAAARRFVTTLREESRPGATLIRLGLVDAPAVRVERQGSLWQVRLAAAGVGPADNASPDDSSSAVPVLIESPTSGLLLPSIDAVAKLTDPLVGDHLGIGMSLAATGPTARPVRFVGLRLQPAAQGAVWRQLAETSREPQWTDSGLYLGEAAGVMRAGTDRLLRGPPAPLLETLPLALDAPVAPPRPPPQPSTSQPADVGMDNRRTDSERSTAAEPVAGDLATVSAEPVATPEPTPIVAGTGSLRPPEASTPPEETAAATATRPLDLARFHSGPERHFWEQRSRLLQAADAAGRQGSALARLELARLHVANGLGPEAVSILATIPEPGPLDGPATEWRALNGAAQFLAGRHTLALDHLSHPELQADSETALWRGATLAALQQWEAALVDWQRGEEWLTGYTTANQAALTEPGIMLLLQTGRIDEAFALIEQASTRALPVASAERLLELEAIALQRDGAIDEARTIWRDLASTGSPEARSRALMSLTLSDLEAGRIDADVAIDRLLSDSVHWRGHKDEVAKRRRLAGVQHDAGFVDEALATLEQALVSEPPADVASLVADDMTAIVEAVFDELSAGKRSATSTLLLYRRYPELVPRGPDGDRRIEALAEALSGLGLDAAAVDSLRMRLAQSQVRDAGRAALGYALASILARNGDSRAAMAALVDSTPIDAIDDPLGTARRALFTEIGRAEDAPTAEPEAPLSMLLEQARRAFDQRDWPTVIEATALLQPEHPARRQLDAASTEAILMAATASRQLGDHAGVARLAAAYGERLASASDDAVLRLLASNARFSGVADELLGEVSSYVSIMREAISGMPPL